MMEMVDSLLSYNHWANRRVIDSLRSWPGRTIQACQLLARVLSDEQAWLAELQKKTPLQLEFSSGLTLDQYQILADEMYSAAATFFRGGAPGHPNGGPVQFSAPDWESTVHLVLRETSIRGQIAAAIRTSGGSPPDIDYLTFLRQAQSSSAPLLSIVVPVHNEGAVLPILLRELREVLGRIDCSYEVIFVDDGSSDDSVAILSVAARSDSRLKVLILSRNFGHQAAITAGLDFARGNAVVIMDADLQDPPEMIPQMLEQFHQGYDVVSAQRISREGEGFLKRVSAAAFYKLMRSALDSRLVPEVGDFRLFSQASIVALRSLREQHRFMRGLVTWLGLREAIVTFHRPPRAEGTTKYSVWKMISFAWTAVSSFSAVPLRLSLLFGTMLTGAGFVYLAYVVYAALVLKITTPGWPSLVALQIIFSGAILLAIGILGDYVGRIYAESKRRPLYVVSDALNASQMWREPERSVVLPCRNASSSTGFTEKPKSLAHRQGA
jgi:dolichol-phosphate mannosyltransferase